MKYRKTNVYNFHVLKESVGVYYGTDYLGIESYQIVEHVCFEFKNYSIVDGEIIKYIGNEISEKYIHYWGILEVL